MLNPRNPPPDKTPPTIVVLPPPPNAPPPRSLKSPQPTTYVLGSYDIEAVTPIDAQRRISLDPSGFEVIDDIGTAAKTRKGNNSPNFYVNCCGCNEDGDDDDKSIGNGSDKTTQNGLYNEQSERVPIPEGNPTSFSFRKLWAFTGPGLLMSVGYLDPGNIESDLQSGTVAKYQLLWVLLWSTFIGLLMQRLAARLGTVSGLHLAEACHRHYPTIPIYILWLLAEIAVIGAEMQEVIGSAIAFYLLSNKAIPLWVGVIIAVVHSFALLILEKFGLRKIEAVFAIMIAIMAGSFGYEYAKVEPNQVEVIKGILIPGCQNCDKSALLQGIGIIGAIIMPHNLFLHSALVKSRDIDRSKPSQVKEANKYYFIEAALALSFSFVINLFIVSVFAHGTWDDDEEGTFRKSNADILQLCINQDNKNDRFTDLFSNDTNIFQPNIYTGGIFLGCQYGDIAMYIWAIGILAAGQSSTMTGAYAGQFVMEGFLNLKLPRWKRSIVTRFFVLMPPFLVAIFLEVDKLSGMNDWINASMSLLLPFAILPLISMTSKDDLMGGFKNGKGTKLFSMTIVLFLISINLYFINSFFFENVNHPMDWYFAIAITSFGIFYISLCAYLFCHAVLSMGTQWWSVEAVANFMLVVTVNILILMLAYFVGFKQ